MIETAIYSRLQTITPNCYPDTPTENSQLPFLVYRVSNTEPQLTTTGVSGLTKYTIEVEAYAVNKAEVSNLQSQIRQQLHGYRGGNVQGSFLQTESGEEIELGYHGVQSFMVWFSTANVTATQDSTGLIRTLNNSVTLTACDNVLELGCDGLTLNGEPVGSPDLSNYARKDDANTFEAPQTIDSIIIPTDTPKRIQFVRSDGEVMGWISCDNNGRFELWSADQFVLTNSGGMVNVNGGLIASQDIYAIGATLESSLYVGRGALGIHRFIVDNDGKIHTDQVQNTPVTGASVKRLPIYDTQNGNLIGYIPVMNA